MSRALGAWLVMLGAFVATLAWRDRPAFSEAHHFWYGSSLWWLGYSAVASAWGPAALAYGVMVLGAWWMLDDLGEHLGLPSFWKTLYGHLGGTK